jgi:isocitrate/isopropylmalate dehydrogenase
MLIKAPENTYINIPVVTVAFGDGIGAEVMNSALLILREAGARIAIESIEIGQRIYNMGSKTGILPSSWEVLMRNKILLKAPTAEPIDALASNTSKALYDKFSLQETMSAGQEMSAWSMAINEDFALFEATHFHDYKPSIAGKNIANPAGMIYGAIAMLKYLEQKNIADLINNALQKTINAGLHTADLYNKETSVQKVSTIEFTDAIIERLY